MGKHKFYEGTWEIKHKDKAGKVLWEETRRNALADEGEQSMLDSYFRGLNVPTAFYARLCNDTLLETDTLAAVQNEPAGTYGYAAQTVAKSAVGFPTLEMDAGDYRVVSAAITFTASGGTIGPVNTAYLATTSNNTGKLLAYVSLSTARTLLDGDQLQVTLRIKLA